jgi:hypothetical protein
MFSKKSLFLAVAAFSSLPALSRHSHETFRVQTPYGTDVVSIRSRGGDRYLAPSITVNNPSYGGGQPGMIVVNNPGYNGQPGMVVATNPYAFPSFTTAVNPYALSSGMACQAVYPSVCGGVGNFGPNYPSLYGSNPYFGGTSSPSYGSFYGTGLRSTNGYSPYFSSGSYPGYGGYASPTYNFQFRFAGNSSSFYNLSSNTGTFTYYR